MPEHPGTRYRVEVGITPKGIIDNSTITIVKDTNSPGKPVCKPGFCGEHHFGIMELMPAELCTAQGRLRTTGPFNITDNTMCRHPGFTGKYTAHLRAATLLSSLPAFLQQHAFREVHQPAAFSIDRDLVTGGLTQGFTHPVIGFELAGKKFRISPADDKPVRIRQTVMNRTEWNSPCPECCEDIEHVSVIEVKCLIERHANFYITGWDLVKERRFIPGIRDLLHQRSEPVKVHVLANDICDRGDAGVEIAPAGSFPVGHKTKMA